MTDNILIIASRNDIAGGENYLLSCLRYLDKNRFHPVIWLPGDGAFRAALEQVDVDYVIEPVNYGWLNPHEPWYGFLSGLSERVHRIVELIRERDIRLVHTNSNQILEGALAAKLCGVPHLYLAHIDFQSNLPIYQRLPFEAASFAHLMGDLSTGILAVSEHVRASLCPPLQPDRITVVHNGLEMDRYDDALTRRDGSLRKELELDADAVIVAAAGRITYDKGFDLLVEAAAKLHSTYPDAMYLIAGPTDSADHKISLEHRIRDLGLADRIRFLGGRNDLPRVFAQSDIFVLSSRREGHPYVLLEAMACNLPSVASRCGGVEETIEEGVSGYAVPISDVEAMAGRLSLLLKTPHLRQEMGLAAGKRIRETFTSERTAQGLFDMYERIIGQPKLPAGCYSVDLLLQATHEIGELGTRLTKLEERSKKFDSAANLILENPLIRAIRRVLGRRIG